MDYGLLRMFLEDTFKFGNFSREALVAKKWSV